MKKWPLVKIDTIAQKIAMGPFGSNIKVDNFVSSGVPVLNGANLIGFKLKEDHFNYVTEHKANELRNSLAYRGDIVITHRGTLGQIVFIPLDSKFDKYLISQSQFLFRTDHDKADYRFITYFFHSPYGQFLLLSNASQVGVPALARPTSAFKSLEIPLPPLKIQKRIADFLCLIDNKIELNARINQNLEAQAQAIFKSWFVDFEPFKGGKFVDSELGPIPEGWSVGALGDIIELHDSKRVPLSGSQREKMRKIYPYYGAASLMDYVEDYLFDGVYLLLGEDGTVVTEDGMPVLQYVWGKFWVNNHAHILTGKRGCSPETLYILLKNTPIKSIVTGAVQPKISQANLKSLPIVISPQELVLKYKESIAPLFAKIRENYDESKRLASLRDTLLPKLMSGEIDVSEIEV